MPKTPPFSSILVGTDGSPSASVAVDHAIDLAHDAGARLILVAAFQPLQPQRSAGDRAPGDSLTAPEDIQFTMGPDEYAQAVLETAAQDAKAAGVANVATYVRQGDPASAILDVAEEQGADLIVVGNKGMTGARRFLVSSVPNNVSHNAPCSVLIVRTSS
jgi:nucleotide-binding universal stress UspA family protein